MCPGDVQLTLVRGSMMVQEQQGRSCLLRQLTQRVPSPEMRVGGRHLSRLPQRQVAACWWSSHVLLTPAAELPKAASKGLPSAAVSKG